MFEDLSLAFTFSPFDGPPTDTSQTQMETQTNTQTDTEQTDTENDAHCNSEGNSAGNKYDTSKEAMKLPANARQRAFSAAVQERGRERAASRNCRTSLGVPASPTSSAVAAVPSVPAVAAVAAVAGKKWALVGACRCLAPSNILIFLGFSLFFLSHCFVNHDSGWFSLQTRAGESKLENSLFYIDVRSIVLLHQRPREGQGQEKRFAAHHVDSVRPPLHDGTPKNEHEGVPFGHHFQRSKINVKN